MVNGMTVYFFLLVMGNVCLFEWHGLAWHAMMLAQPSCPNRSGLAMQDVPERGKHYHSCQIMLH